jgi:aspartyl-tRNA(Asn)/glutamyl-tRNA(Gln) amidotransferase subunit C
MSISKDEVRHIARLARLELSEEDLEGLKDQLEEILRYIDKLKPLDVSKVLPMAHVLALKNVCREDVPGDSLDPQEVLRLSPGVEGNFFKVPKVIE